MPLPSRALTATIAHVSAIDVDDGTLIERVAAHERVAFEELYRRFARTVLGLALRRIDEEAEASWNAWRVHRALETLPEHERSVIDLAYFSGLSRTEEEIAVGLPTGADLDEPTGQHIATCPACAAEQDSLRQVRSLRGLAR